MKKNVLAVGKNFIYLFMKQIAMYTKKRKYLKLYGTVRGRATEATSEKRTIIHWQNWKKNGGCRTRP